MASGMRVPVRMKCNREEERLWCYLRTSKVLCVMIRYAHYRHLGQDDSFPYPVFFLLVSPVTVLQYADISNTYLTASQRT